MAESSKYSINAEVVQITEMNQGTIVGKQVQPALTAKQAKASDAVVQLLQQLHQKYPDASHEEIFNILLQGFQAMPQRNPQKWQRWQDLLNVIFAGGLEAAKIFVPVVGIPIEVLKRLYEIYARNQKQLPGN